MNGNKEICFFVVTALNRLILMGNFNFANVDTTTIKLAVFKTQNVVDKID